MEAGIGNLQRLKVEMGFGVNSKATDGSAKFGGLFSRRCNTCIACEQELFGAKLLE